MIYLAEREIGFDGASIGFPSVDGCRAMVLVTSGGLIGYHLNGTLTDQKLDNIRNFVNAQGHGIAKRKLYVASRMGGNGLTVDQAKAEIKMLAKKLKYKGSIYYADVTSFNGGSVYILFESVGNNTCVISARAWSDATDRIPGNKGNYVGANRAIANGGAPTKMWTNVDPAGLRVAYPTDFAD